MLHLLQHAVSPALLFEETLRNWFAISCALRESPRERLMQVEKNGREGSYYLIAYAAEPGISRFPAKSG